MSQFHHKTDSPQLRKQVHIPGPILITEGEEYTAARMQELPTVVEEIREKQKGGTARTPVPFEFQAHFDPAVEFLRTLDIGRPTTYRPPSHRCVSPDPKSKAHKEVTRAFVHCSSAVTVLDQLLRPLTGRRGTRSVRRLARSTRDESTENSESAVSLCVGREPVISTPPPALPKVSRMSVQPSVMDYYRRLSVRPKHAIRTPATHQKRVASRSGYRTKLQKDPVLRRSALGHYEYKDCYDLDEVFMRKMHRALSSRKAGH